MRWMGEEKWKEEVKVKEEKRRGTINIKTGRGKSRS